VKINPNFDALLIMLRLWIWKQQQDWAGHLHLWQLLR